SVSGGSFTLAPGETREVTVSFTPSTAANNKTATLRMVTNDPGLRQIDVWLTNSRTIVDVDAEADEGGDEAQAQINVTDAQPNEEVTANISQPSTRDEDVAIDEVSATPAQQANFTLDVSISDEPFGRNFTRTDVATPVLYVRVESTIPDEVLSGASFEFRVSKAELQAVNATPDEMTMYRLSDGTWSELNITLIGETRTHFRYLAQAPGFSDFATGAKKPDFEISEASVSVSAVRIGESVDILTRITNAEGAADGTFTVELLLNGEVVESRDVTIAAGGIRQVVFERSFSDAGTFEVRVNDVTAGEISVEEADEPGDGPGTGPAGASFAVGEIEVSDRTVQVDDTVEVSATIENNGTEEGTYTAAFEVNGVVVDRRNVTVPANATATVSFSRAFSQAGRFQVSIGGGEVTEITVEEAEGAQPDSNLSVQEASLGRETIEAGESVTISAAVVNDGEESGSLSVDLVVEGVAVRTTEVTVPAGGSETVEFSRTFEEPGEFEVAVGDATAGTLTVEAGATPTPTEVTTTVTTTDDGGIPNIPGFGVGPAVLAILLAIALLARRREPET
ncbi:MAG: CARDB domain-containing protein, partial [Halobacteriales archaeon]